MIKKIFCIVIIFFSIVFSSEIVSKNQFYVPYVLSLILFATIFFIDKFLISKFYISYIVVSLLILFGVLIEIFSCNKADLVYESFFHILEIPIIFVGYYAFKERKKFILILSIFLIFLIFGLNFFYRDTITDYRLYGTEKDLISKNIIIRSIKVKSKNAIDTIIYLDSNKYLIDFWSLYCPGCYADMPILDSIHKNNSKFRIISLLVPSRKKTAKEFEKLNNIKNSYQSFYLSDTIIPKKLNIDRFPSYFILYNQKIIYKGRLENVVNKINNNPENAR